MWSKDLKLWVSQRKCTILCFSWSWANSLIPSVKASQSIQSFFCLSPLLLTCTAIQSQGTTYIHISVYSSLCLRSCLLQTLQTWVYTFCIHTYILYRLRILRGPQNTLLKTQISLLTFLMIIITSTHFFYRIFQTCSYFSVPYQYILSSVSLWTASTSSHWLHEDILQLFLDPRLSLPTVHASLCPEEFLSSLFF